MAGGALGRRECPLGHGSSRRVGEALELSQRLASFAFPQHRQRGASYRAGINVELAKMGERSSETRCPKRRIRLRAISFCVGGISSSGIVSISAMLKSSSAVSISSGSKPTNQVR